MKVKPKNAAGVQVVVLGAAGVVGRVAAEAVAKLNGIHSLIVADINETAVRATMSALRHPGKVRVEPQRIDVTDAAKLRHLLDRADVVLNVTGPYYRFGVPILEAAIESHTHYLDICDDWEPTVDMLGFHERAKTAGITAVIGIGISPGVSNLLAAMAVRDIDTVHDLHTAWPVDVEEEGQQSEINISGYENSAAVVHWMEQISGRIQVVQNGQLVLQAPLQPVQLSYPGRGSGTAYTVGHPEPITLFDHVPIHGHSACLMVITPPTLAYLDRLRKELDAKTLTNEEAARRMMQPSTWGEVSAFVRSIGVAGPGALPPFFVLATGVQKDRQVTVGVSARSFPADMGLATGLPLATGLRELLEDRVAVYGVLAPESAFQPESFLAHLAPLWGVTTTELFSLQSQTNAT